MDSGQFIAEAKRREQAKNARNLRYKRGALASLGWDYIRNTLDEIVDACSDVHWFYEDEGDSLVDALDGDEDEAFEFKMAFGELEGMAAQINEQIDDLEYYQEDFGQHFDDCTVALLGNRFQVIGYDSYEEDYYSLCGYEANLAQTESGKRLMRLTKAEMISQIGQCLGILIAFYDLERQYEYLKATMDILRGENNSILQVVRKIEEAYENAANGSLSEEREFDRLIKELPERCWLE